jgi:hypothetical protein
MAIQDSCDRLRRPERYGRIGAHCSRVSRFIYGAAARRELAEELALHFVTQAERAAMKEIRWWTITELERTSETVFPTDLAVVLRRLVEPGVRLP